MKISAILSLAAVIGTISIFIAITRLATQNTVYYHPAHSPIITIIDSTPQQRIPLALPINTKFKSPTNRNSA